MTVAPTVEGTLTVNATVASTYACDSDSANNSAEASLAAEAPPSSSSASEDDSGCGCRLPADRSSDRGWQLLLGLLVAAVLSRGFCR